LTHPRVGEGGFVEARARLHPAAIHDDFAGFEVPLEPTHEAAFV
jgi:hypothetical protein